MRLVLIFIIFFLISSCSYDYNEDYMRETCEWIFNNIKYESEKGKDNWKLPKETEKDKKGDCEDMAILLMDKAKKEKGYNTLMIGYKTKKGEFHAVVECQGNYYDCTSGEVKSNCENIKVKYTYEQVLYLAEYIKN